MSHAGSKGTDYIIVCSPKSNMNHPEHRLPLPHYYALSFLKILIMKLLIYLPTSLYPSLIPNSTPEQFDNMFSIDLKISMSLIWL